MMAVYLMENPANISQYQLEGLSHTDLMAWWGSTGIWFKKFNDLTKAISELRWLQRDNIDLLKKTTQSFTSDQVNYHAAADNKCASCKWYVSHNLDNSKQEKGHCKIVRGEIDGNYGCDRYEKHVVTKQCDCENKEPDAEEHADPMPVDGKCPEGWMISEDGTQCTKPMAQAEAVPAHKIEHKEVQHAMIEADPVQDQNLKIAGLNEEIQKHEKELKLKRRMLSITPVMHAGRLAGEVDGLEREITRLTALKKKSS